MAQPPAFRQLSDEQLRLAIRRVLETTAGTKLQPSPTLNDELRTLQALGLLPMTVTLDELRTTFDEVQRELDDEVHASRASRRSS